MSSLHSTTSLLRNWLFSGALKALSQWLGALICLLSMQAQAAQSASQFPVTSNPQIQAKAFDLAGGELRDFAIAPNRTEVFVLVRNRTSEGQLNMAIRVFDANAKLLRQRVLASIAKSDQAELFFTRQGSLIWNDNRFFRFIAPDSLSTRSFQQCRATAYPLLQAHQSQASAAAIAWRDAQRQQLNQKFGFAAAQIAVSNSKIPPEYWTSYRQISADAELKSNDFLLAAYQNMLAGIKNQTAPKTGLIIEHQYRKAHYASVQLQGQDWYCDFGELAKQYDVQWQALVVAPGSKSMKPLAPLTLAGDQLQQGQLQLKVLDRRKTSTYQQDLVGPMQFDTEIDRELRRQKFLGQIHALMRCVVPFC